jgi:ribosomal protein S18 acetylase RimI-like enzyme
MISIRPTRVQEAAAILRLAAAEPLFTAEEADTVNELLTDYFEKPDHNGYFFLTADLDGRVAGFACYGPTALTKGTFDLYWICVGRDFARRGIGKALMDRAQVEVRRAEGRLVVVETSGTPEYAPTRAFYEKLGYARVATVPEFYGPDNDLVIYTRKTSPS